MIKSKFSLWVIPVIFVLLVLSAINYLVFKNLALFAKYEPSFGLLVFIVLLAFTWAWLVFGKLRTKIIVVKIEENVITVTNFLGVGRRNQFDSREFDGYKTALLPSKVRAYEYLYLMKDGKKKIKISQFYHRNYSLLKIGLAKKVKFIGHEQFSYLREFKEIFE